MRVVALISGGKDSCFNMMHCIANGHEIVALANLKPPDKGELDSYMFQTVGHDVIDCYAEAIGLPLFRRTINGSPVCTDSNYMRNDKDEVEDLFELLKEVKDNIDFSAVSCGAILSNYQRVRVENVCRRLGVQSLSYLWQRNQDELLVEMIQANVEAILIKVAVLGLKPCLHLGKTLNEMVTYLREMNKKYEVNVCGEGGEYETITLDCPLFLKKIVVDEKRIIIHSDDAFAPVGYLSFAKVHLEDKDMDPSTTLSQRILNCKLEIPKLFEKSMLEYFPKSDLKKVNSNFVVKTVNRAAIKLNRGSNPQFFTTNDRAWVTELICIQDGGTSLETATLETMKTLQTLLTNNNYTLGDISFVNVFCSSMRNFAKINSIYRNFFVTNPPARVCIEIPLPATTLFKMDVCISKSSTYTRDALHVESISYWAPANIGPYSQVVKVGNQIYFSGSIGMDPSSLNLIEGGLEKEATLSLHHVHEISKVFMPNRKSYKDNGLVNCYIVDETKTEYIYELFKCQEMFDSSSYLLNIVTVPCLPKDALVEWNVLSSINGQTLGDAKIHEDESFKFNLNFFTLKVLSSDLETYEHLTNVLVHYFNQYIFAFNKTQFMRVYYLHHIYNDGDDIKTIFITSFKSVVKELPAVSFVPVLGLERDTIIVITGCTFH